MKPFIAWENDIPLGLDKATFLQCFSPISHYHDDEHDVDYWLIKIKAKTIYVYDWDGEMYINDSQINEKMQAELEKCSEKQTSEKVKNIDEMLGKMSVGNDDEWTIPAFYPDKNKVLIDVLHEIEEMNYASNCFTDKKHEGNVEDILKNNGFIKTTSKLETNGLYYIPQPNGAQAPPDFRIFANDEQLDIECKSCKQGYKPMWNASYPKEDMAYVYTNKRDNNTLLFLGSEIVTPEVKEIYDEYVELNKKLHSEINQKLNRLNERQNPYGMQVYARNMFVQTKHLRQDNKHLYKQRLIEKMKKNNLNT